MESSSHSSSSVLRSNTSNTLSTSNASTSAATHSQSSLKALNRASYKISKPAALSGTSNPKPLPKAQPRPLPSASAGVSAAGSSDSDGGAPLQPPVYNIDKNDFRDVVQKLTGFPAFHHARSAVPSPTPPPTASANSRLHRIRPPPLSQFASLPYSLPSVAHLQAAAAAISVTNPWTRPPFSPLPPLPTVSTAAESPISAYMRGLRAGCDQPTFTPPTGIAPLPSTLGPLSSPLATVCLPSPRTAYQMMMTPALVSPTSPRVQLHSPRLNDP